MKSNSEHKIYDCIIIGCGQAGLSVGYFFRRTKLEYLILDEQDTVGGAWLKTWDSLKLFSPAAYSSLSGWQMPNTEEEYPSKNEFIKYITAYEKRYNFPVNHKTTVLEVVKEANFYKITTNKGDFYSKTLVSATGTAKNPFIPKYPNDEVFKGKQIHSVAYKNANDLKGKNVIVVGGGNSGAQILAEVSKVAKTKWVTLKEPKFLPKEIDGRYLFKQATESYVNNDTKSYTEKVSLSDIVQVKSVQEALKRGVFKDYRPFTSFYDDGVIWEDNTKEPVDVIIWCTGFRANLEHLSSLHITENNKINTTGTKATDITGLWLVGYGNWTGFASATIYGVGKTAKQTVKEIVAYVNGLKNKSL
ncbi:ArsO family NAD(P)H-dependent flavin-containing monooxygenase [Cellulophaga sp. 20_2_10]|uniref:ArsO family NAD(P)H-dependent flavin-containing monooxygenase n=1 Tax=Cellulophaga sp. 20_2_10 TaxID=2942476 RepID=UPI00201B14DF|nr:ArsO family NAD(P)H-dependent flavin-containing monooxygenase [Cellulophaga sp. 20_2_10]MCL5246826.1 ArsO family NAD(P)H-dependent flavin-containing monooxygenase [Cellulophaga sp. 20_2_10]